MFKSAIVLLLVSVGVYAEDFRGWEGMRVIAHEGSSGNFKVIKSKIKGREILCSVNRQQSRIDIFSYVDAKDRKNEEKSERPNEIVFPNDFKRDEIILDRFPVSLVTGDVDKNGDEELYVLTSNPMAINKFEFKKDKWEKTYSWRLLQEQIGFLPLLINDGKAYFSTNNGIMVLELKKNEKAKWLLPAEKNVKRRRWWFVDVNRDGNKDLLDLRLDTEGSLAFTWMKNLNGKLLPAVPLGKMKATDANVDMNGDELVFYLLNSVKRETVSTYKIVPEDQESTYGANRIQPLLNSNQSLRTSLVIEGKKVLVEVHPLRPQMRVSELTDNGFYELGNFPVLRNIQTVTAVPGKQMLLYKIKDSTDLYFSKWANGRFTFPRTYTVEKREGTKKLLGLDRYGETVWWAQSFGKDLVFYKWSKGKEKPEATVYAEVGSNLNTAKWLGNNHFMVRKKYAKYADYYDLKDGKPLKMSVSNLKDAIEMQFYVYQKGDELITARIVDGVVQWLDEKLQPIDQVMLDDGRMIVDAVLTPEGSMMALESGGKSLITLTKDKAGIMREKDSQEIIAAERIFLDPVLGLNLSDKIFLNAPVKGTGLKLELIHTVDSKLGLPAGVKDASISRFILSDVVGSERKELFNVDFQRRQLTLVNMDGKPTSLASWKVYDDGKYPYDDGRDDYQRGYPYTLAALDFDGDGVKELVIPCHDRLLIYIGREKK